MTSMRSSTRGCSVSDRAGRGLLDTSPTVLCVAPGIGCLLEHDVRTTSVVLVGPVHHWLTCEPVV
jgi:hypothetical protein